MPLTDKQQSALNAAIAKKQQQNYINSEFSGFSEEKQEGFKYTIQLSGIGHKTKNLSVSEKQLQAIKQILLESE